MFFYVFFRCNALLSNSEPQALSSCTMESEHFDETCIATDQPKLQLGTNPYMLCCPLAQVQPSIVSSVGASSDNSHLHDWCICLLPASRDGSDRHCPSTSVYEVQGTSRHDASDLWVLRNLKSQTSLRALAACSFFNADSYGSYCQCLHSPRGRFHETPLNVINYDQHTQSRSPAGTPRSMPG